MSDFFNILLFCAAIYLTGFNILLYFFPKIIERKSLLFLIPLMFASGVGVGSTIFFILAYFNKLSVLTPSVFIIATILLTVTAIARVALLKRAKSLFSISWSDIVFVIILLAVFYPLITFSLNIFLVSWDAAAMWFLKAKAIYLSGGLRDNFYFMSDNYIYSAKFYPIGGSILISAYYQIAGFVNDQHVQFFLLQFYLMSMILGYAAFRHFLPRISAILAAILTLSFFSTPLFLQYAHNGYLDLALGFMIAVTVALLCHLIYRGDDAQSNFQHYILTLFIAASAANFKNEGLPFFVFTVIFASSALILAKTTEILPSSKKKTLFHIIPLILVLTPIMLWRILISTLKIPFWLNIQDNIAQTVSRLKQISYFYLEVFANTTFHGIILIPLVLLIIFQTTVILSKRKFHQLLPLLLLSFQLASYTLAYVLTSLPLQIQLRTSFERLLLQLLPSLFIIAVYGQSRIWEKMNDNSNVKTQISKLKFKSKN